MKISKKNIKLWKANSPAGFDAWLQDVTPRILHRNSQYKIFKPTPSQDTTINEVLSSKNGKFQRSMSIEIQPRRHGKSTVFALICLWLFTSRRNLTIQLLGNTEQHCRRTQFNTLEKIIRNTPILSSSILESDIRQYSIFFSSLIKCNSNERSKYCFFIWRKNIRLVVLRSPRLCWHAAF